MSKLPSWDDWESFINPLTHVTLYEVTDLEARTVSLITESGKVISTRLIESPPYVMVSDKKGTEK